MFERVQLTGAHRERRSLSRWTGTLVALVTLARGAGVPLTLFTLAPLSGLSAYPLWMILGDVPIVAEWLLAGVLVVAGIVAAATMKSIWGFRRARNVGWFVVVDTVVYAAPVGAVLAVEFGSRTEPWWQIGAAIVTVNATLAATAGKLIRKATSAYRTQRALLRWQYVRKDRPAAQ